jgi:hypothetical protein
MRLLRIVLIAAAAAAIASCGGGGGSASPLPVGTGTTVASSIGSAQTGISYALDIWLPEGYATATATYPVIYAMDCEYRFATLTAVLQQADTKAILVNVCAGSTDRRWVDFTMPGAAAYYRFLTLELIPAIDAAYRTNPGNRILSGHSLSGEFVMYALYMEQPANRYFSSIVSEECSCWYDATMHASASLALPLAMEQAMYDADHSLPINLVMAGDSLSNEGAVAPVYDEIAARHYQNLRSIQPVYRVGHIPMDGPAFADALSFIFAP